MLDLRVQRSVTVIAGSGRTGKTTCGNLYLVNAPFDFRFVFDPENEASQRLNLSPTLTEFDLAAHLVRGVVLFDPSHLFGSNYEAAFAFFCDWVFAKCAALPGKKVLMVDEVWKLCPNRTIPTEFANCIRTGSKRGLATMLLSQTPNELPGLVMNEVSEFISFRLQSSPALALAGRYGFDEDEVKSLPDLHFVSRTDQGGELRGRLTF